MIKSPLRDVGNILTDEKRHVRIGVASRAVGSSLLVMLLAEYASIVSSMQVCKGARPSTVFYLKDYQT